MGLPQETRTDVGSWICTLKVGEYCLGLKDMLAEQSQTNLNKSLLHLLLTIALQNSDRIGIESKLVCLIVSDDKCPCLLDLTQVAGHFFCLLSESKTPWRRSSTPQGSINSEVKEKCLSAMLAIDLQKG